MKTEPPITTTITDNGHLKCPAYTIEDFEGCLIDVVGSGYGVWKIIHEGGVIRLADIDAVRALRRVLERIELRDTGVVE